MNIHKNNNNMVSQQMQDNNLTPDEAKASLGLSSSLMEKLMPINPQMMPQAPIEGQESEAQSPQNAPERENDLKAQKLPEKKEEKNPEFEEQVLSEISDIKAQIQEILEEEKAEDKEEEQTDDTGKEEQA